MIKPSDNDKGIIGIAGHVGIGHAFSNMGLRAEDSVGFAVLYGLLNKCYQLDYSVKSIKVEDGHNIVLETGGGGIGKAYATRGFTPYEIEILQRGLGVKNMAPQSFASYVFGRIYGHGILDHACALSLAHARALLDTVRKTCKTKLHFAHDNVKGSDGEFLGGVFSINDVDISWLLTINCGTNCTGPNEDSEGIVPIGNKGKIMEKIGMLSAPTFVIDGKLYNGELSKPISTTNLLVRWNKEIDNHVVGECLVKAAKECAYPVTYFDNAYIRDNTLEKSTKKHAEKLMEIAKAYGNATTSAEKVALAAKLSIFSTEEIGGSLYMSEQVFNIAGSGGLWPGQAAMLSFLITEKEMDHWKTIILTDEDVNVGVDCLIKATKYLYERYDEALKICNLKKNLFSAESLAGLLSD